MYDQLKEDVDSHQRWKRDVQSEDYANPDGGKYEWCMECLEQTVNCKCEAIRIAEERIQAWSAFDKALWAEEGVAEAQKIIETMGFSQEDIEHAIENVAQQKIYNDYEKHIEWIKE